VMQFVSWIDPGLDDGPGLPKQDSKVGAQPIFLIWNAEAGAILA